jgi:hypothetical protein
MPTAQWTLPPLSREWGFDDGPNPSWFMVPHNPGAQKILRLAFGQGKTVKSVNERICAVTPTGPDPADPDGVYFWFTGKSPGNTRVEVRRPGAKVPETVLAVSVFAPRTISLTFHFVEDRGRNRTTRQPGILPGLVSDLDGIFEHQTAVTFETWEPGNELKLPFDVVDAVYEGKDLADKNLGSNWGELIGRRQWEQVFRKNNDGRSYNIYFTPTIESAATNDNALPYVDWSNKACIIEDGREPVENILPHAIGRLMGCPLQESNREHLMFWDAVLRRTGDFIPKECARMIHDLAG